MVNSYVKKRQSTFFVKEGSLMAKGLHQGLLGSIRYPSTSPLFKAVLNKTTYCISFLWKIFALLQFRWFEELTLLEIALELWVICHLLNTFVRLKIHFNKCEPQYMWSGAWWGRLFNVGWKFLPTVCWALAAEPHPLLVLHLRNYPRRHKENIMFVSVSSIVI